MEGGFTADDFNAHNRSALTTTEGVLSLAMMLEAQAMDLYLRYADRRVDSQAKKILCQIADEEKAHLHSQGALLAHKM
jgi:rubrerythrin